MQFQGRKFQAIPNKAIPGNSRKCHCSHENSSQYQARQFKIRHSQEISENETRIKNILENNRPEKFRQGNCTQIHPRQFEAKPLQAIPSEEISGKALQGHFDQANFKQRNLKK